MDRSTSKPSTDGVLLREVSEADLPIFFAQQLDPEATQMADFPARDEAAFMAHWAKILRNEQVIARTILFDGAVAGNIGSFEQDGQRQVGYWLGREYWARGVASKALAVFLAQQATRPLYAHVVKHNVASQRVLQKCGFALLPEEEGDEFIFILEA